MEKIAISDEIRSLLQERTDLGVLLAINGKSVDELSVKNGIGDLFWGIDEDGTVADVYSNFDKSDDEQKERQLIQNKTNIITGKLVSQKQP